jgi:hypothetical protein
MNLEQDILEILPFGGGFLSVAAVTERIAPLREREVRGALNALVKRRVLDLNPGGGGWVATYGRHAIKRRV